MNIYSKHLLSHPDTIRILVLVPSASSANPTIACNLDTIRLSEVPSGSKDIAYNTLSYTWGSIETSYHILVDDIALPVGRNLYVALQYLRVQDRPLRMWVDAICINQCDTLEREQQVQLMRDIYASSEKTIIFLGEEYEGSCSNAWSLLEYRDPDQRKVEGVSLKDHYRQLARRVNFQNAYSDILDNIVAREWFRRIWVLQELVVSKHVEIRCGSRRTSWENFTRTLFLYFHHDLEDENELWGQREAIVHELRAFGKSKSGRETRPGWDYVRKTHPDWQLTIQGIREMCQTRSLYQQAHGQTERVPRWLLNNPLAHFIEDDVEYRHGSLRLVALLSRGRRYLSTDPRDKVIALLGICTDFAQQELENLINYTRTKQQLYRDVVRMIVEKEGLLDILCHAGGLLETEKEFASWAGKWDSADFPKVSVLSRLGSESQVHATDRKTMVEKHHAWSENGTLLYCTGGRMGTLVSISELNMPTDTRNASIGVSNSDVDGPASLDRVAEFNYCAKELLELYHWGPGPEALDTQLWDVSIDAQLSPFSDTWWDVIVTYSYKGLGEPPLDISPLPQQINVSGGRGFIDDVAALQQGRKFGLVKSQSPEYDRDKPVYSFAVFPDCARIGDVVASFSGAKTLFLIYPEEVEAQIFERQDAEMIDILPKSDKVGEKALHCRIRGECRANAFEDTWGLVDKVPLMTYAGYVPPEWKDTIFAIH